ncbi:MAG: DNA polymerase Y family protein [Chitinophagaceae bacterium]
MPKRFIAIWFRHLVTDWLIIKKPALQTIPFVFAAPDHGRMRITAASTIAQKQGIYTGMMLADARALLPGLEVFDDKPARAEQLLKGIAAFCIRYTPIAAIDPPDGIILDISGCAHLWGGERPYLAEVITRLKSKGYTLRAAIGDTIGIAWAIARFGKETAIIERGNNAHALLALPPAALRLPMQTIERLQKLGFYQIGRFINMPRSALRRRFGDELLCRMDQALGSKEEALQPFQAVVIYQERLPCMEPIVTATGITIALQRLLGSICQRLQQEEKGMRTASFTGYRTDGKIIQVAIGTNRPSHNTRHLFKLFEPRIDSIEPAMGIELFILDATKVEVLPAGQQKIWVGSCGIEDQGLAELLDRIANRMGAASIHRYIPDEHYWPERSIKEATTLQEKANTPWQTDRRRPTQVLPKPEPIEVTAPVPDYPPMLFRYKNKLHKIKKADGPERIEREWWLEEGAHRDYYYVEDEEGGRYWLFRLGHYTAAKTQQWFIHGFFA